jgi:hypothetical protein
MQIYLLQASNNLLNVLSYITESNSNRDIEQATANTAVSMCHTSSATAAYLLRNPLNGETIIPRVYPPSKPHQGSGRQAEPLIKLRSDLRQGVDSLIIACKYDPLPILKVKFQVFYVKYSLISS